MIRTTLKPAGLILLTISIFLGSCGDLNLGSIFPGDYEVSALVNEADIGSHPVINRDDLIARFKEAVESLKQAGVEPGIVHAANTGGVVFHEESWFDMVRPGILLYGYAPAESALRVEPVMELVSRITFIKKVRKGESVSYGRIWTAPGDRVIATIPLGYGDGFPRALGGNHRVYIRGRPYPLVGRICMDQCMIDLGADTDIGRWEEVTVFGGAAPGAGYVAGRLGTIPYEITCNIDKRVPRVYL